MKEPPNAIAGPVQDTDADTWQRWMRAWDVLFYAALILGLVVALGERFRGTDDRPLIIVLAATSALWYSYFGDIRRIWTKSSGWAATFLAVEATIWLALIQLNPIFVFSGFGMLAHVCGLNPRWAYVVAAILGGGIVLQEVTEQGPIAWVVLVNAAFIAGMTVILSRLVFDIARRSEERRRLIAELKATQADLAAAEREAGTLAERHRLARDIHDTLAQGFTSIVMLLEAAEADLDNDIDKVRKHIDRARKTARESLAEARGLVWGLRSRRLLGGSVNDAIKSLVDQFRSETSLQSEFIVSGDTRRLPPATEEGLLRIAQEALTNIRKHASASRVSVTLSYLPDQVALEVRDDGVGFEPATLAGTESLSGGIGLQAMLERVEELDGSRRIESGRGEGSAILVKLPLPSAIDRESSSVVEAS